jgi:hypothetical protein
LRAYKSQKKAGAKVIMSSTDTKKLEWEKEQGADYTFLISDQFKTEMKAKNSQDAANSFYKNLSEHFNNSVRQFNFSVQKGLSGDGKLYHFQVKEKRENNEVDFKITPLKIKGEHEVTEKFKEKLASFKEKFNSQEGGKKKKSSSSAAANTKTVVPSNSSSTGIPAMASGGLRRDRMPTLLEPGEFVIRRPAVNRIGVNNLAQMNATGKANNNAAPIINIKNEGTQKDAQASSPRFDGEKYVIDIIMRDLANNGPVRRSLRGGAI